MDSITSRSSAISRLFFEDEKFDYPDMPIDDVRG